MIPKIVHFCWLSGDDYPDLIQRCIESWNQHLQDYEIWVWDTKRFDINSCLWTKQAFEKKKYAFAADYIRLYALYNYGGIYLDSDVLVYKSFDDLLNLPYFIGTDQNGCFEPAIIGAEKHCDWIGIILKRYKERAFILEDGTLDTTPLPRIFYKELVLNFSFRKVQLKQTYSTSTIIYLFDTEFFNARNSIEVHPTENSYCAHNYAGSWCDNPKTLKEIIRNKIPKLILKWYFDLYHSLKKNPYRVPIEK